MAEDNKVPVLSDAMLEAFSKALREGAIRLPPDAPNPADVLTGKDATTLKRTVALFIDDELSRRQVLSEREIRAIAKDVAQAVYDLSIKNVDAQIQKFFTREGIEEIMIDLLKEAGIKADDKHIDETKETLEAMQRNHKRAARVGNSFIEETGKAIVQQLVGGGVIGAIVYALIKAGGK